MKSAIAATYAGNARRARANSGMATATAAATQSGACSARAKCAAARKASATIVAPPSPRARTIGVALAASQSIDVAVPPGTKRAIVVASGANVARLKEGRAIGSVNDTPIRIGDVADFGFMRREQFFTARNPLPARPVADIRGYGQAAFLYGAGFVVVPGAESLHISAAPDLPANARLQVESVDFE